jgi:hypothetical protein
VDVATLATGFQSVGLGLDQKDGWLAVSVWKAMITTNIKTLDHKLIDKGQVAPSQQVALCCLCQALASDHVAHLHARHDNDIGRGSQKVSCPGVKFTHKVTSQQHLHPWIT